MAAVLCIFPHDERTAAAHETSLVDVGVASVDITPTTPIRLMGYGSRREEASQVAQPLYAKALAIGSDAQGAALVITLDLIGPIETHIEQLAARLREKAGIERARLAVCGTHTHTGPCLADSIPNIFGEPLPAAHEQHIRQYTSELLDKLEHVALAALADRRPSQLAWGQGRVGFAINRRLMIDGVWTGFGEVPSAPVDHAVPILRVTDPSGKLRAVLVNYACHCTTLTGTFNEIHGDWAGEAAAILQREHPGATALIAIGCGADANPLGPRDLSGVAAHGRALADEVNRLLKTELTPLPAPTQCRLEYTELPFGELPSRAELESIAAARGREAYWAQMQLDKLDRGESLPTSLRYPVQVWTFGNRLAMVFLAGEVVVDYALRLKTEFDSDRLWINAYSNDLPCYIASRRVIAEGGYEVDASMKSYDRPARFDPAVEDTLISAARQLVPEAFAQPAGE